MAKLDTNTMAKKTLDVFQSDLARLINDSLKDGVPMEGVICTLDIQKVGVTNLFLRQLQEQNMKMLAASIADKKPIITSK